MNIQPFFADMELTVENGKVKMAMTLPAGSTENVNPALLFGGAQRLSRLYALCTDGTYWPL